MYPQQPNDPYYGGQPPYQPGPAVPSKMPGSAITVRVLMFIGGVIGVLLGLLLWLLAVVATGDDQFSRDFLAGMEEGGLPLNGGEAGLFLGIMGGIPFLYGALSILLASLMGRRSVAILWSVVVFQILAALFLLFTIVTGGFASILPLLFAIGMVVLMLLPITRAFYENKPSQPGHPMGY